MAGRGKRIKRDSLAYACQANHYDWAYPREKWTVCGNKFMSLPEIRQEEERLRNEDAVNARAARKRKHQAARISILLEEEDQTGDAAFHENNDMMNKQNALSSDDCHKECGETAPSCLFAMAPTAHADNHPEILQQLQEKVALLEKEIARLQKSEYRWKMRYNHITREEMVEKYCTATEWADKATEYVMQLEDKFMVVCGRRGENARHEYRKAFAFSMWTNESSFYEYLRPLLVAHVKKHLRDTVFHPAKILMRMDLAGGTLSMEGLEVLRMCETDGRKYVRNTVICSPADIKCCCAKVDTLAKSVLPYEHGFLDEDNGGGEYIQWDPRHLLAGMISAYQLTEVAKDRPVEVHIAIDGANLSKNWNHLTAGAKQGDNAAFCPRRQQLIYGNTDTATIQSRDHCFPYIIAMV